MRFTQIVCCAVEKGLPMVKGLREWIQWIDEHGIKKCAVTNAPRKNAEVMLEALGLEWVFRQSMPLSLQIAWPRPQASPLDILKVTG